MKYFVYFYIPFLLRQITLEEYYRAANAELNIDFDTTIADGLENEAW